MRVLSYRCIAGLSNKAGFPIPSLSSTSLPTKFLLSEMSLHSKHSDDEKLSRESDTEAAVQMPKEPGYSYDMKLEKQLVRKLDWHLLPLISVMHLLSFLYVHFDPPLKMARSSLFDTSSTYRDRSNFGNAKAAGYVCLAWLTRLANTLFNRMEKTLHLGDNQFNVAAAVFYIAYALFEVSLIIACRLAVAKRVGPGAFQSLRVLSHDCCNDILTSSQWL